MNNLRVIDEKAAMREVAELFETIPDMQARHAKEVADLQGQIERLTLDLDQANMARERAEKQAADNLLAFNLVAGLIDSLSKQATAP